MWVYIGLMIGIRDAPPDDGELNMENQTKNEQSRVYIRVQVA